uniref:AlNc14C474G11846 protein n=1 Tax=Albugo laibachii Nc14 TaxID=890382 RepID=F0X0A9_9STRA|nr:AlNc14C474G11846 [Albugo laibachii Nc14]|eukprot:CCA27192.1 AlNc14C474G11846 [Albugo laibachii Nc14]
MWRKGKKAVFSDSAFWIPGWWLDAIFGLYCFTPVFMPLKNFSSMMSLLANSKVCTTFNNRVDWGIKCVEYS